MKILRKYRKIAAIFTMTAYLFIALFSQYFHHHFHSDNKQSASVISQGKTIVFNKISSQSENCLSCHFIIDGHALGNEIFENIFFIPQTIHLPIKGLTPDFHQEFSQLYFLRGPPSIIDFTIIS